MEDIVKKSILQIITLALVVVNLVLTVILAFTCMPAISKTSNLVNKVCEIIDLDVTGSSGESTTVAVENLEEVQVTFSSETDATINLKTDVDGKSHVILLGVTLVVDKSHPDYKTKRATIDTAMSLINNRIIDVISKYTMTEAQNNKIEIRKEILGQIQELFDSDFIYDISFTQFVFQ